MTNSRTVYKDELIRVASLIGLPDDVEPTRVADLVAARLATVETAQPAQPVVSDMSRRLLAVIEEAANRLDRSRQAIANSQGFADMTLTIDYLRSELTAAQAAAPESAPNA